MTHLTLTTHINSLHPSKNNKSIKSLHTTKKVISIYNALENSSNNNKKTHHRVKTEEMSNPTQTSTGIHTNMIANNTAMSSCFITNDHNRSGRTTKNNLVKATILSQNKKNLKTHTNKSKGNNRMIDIDNFIKMNRTLKCQYGRNKPKDYLQSVREKLKRKITFNQSNMSNVSFQSYLLDNVSQLIEQNQLEKCILKNRQIRQSIEKYESSNNQQINLLNIIKIYNNYSQNLQMIVKNDKQTIRELQKDIISQQRSRNRQNQKLVIKFEQIYEKNIIQARVLNKLKAKGIDIDQIIKEEVKKHENH